MEATFIAKVISDSRITIPKEICDIKNIKTGDYVQVKIEKVDKEG